MIEDYRKSAANTQWTYRWNISDNPVVMFANSRVSANIIFSIDELRSTIESTERQVGFASVPKQTMINALLEVDEYLAVAA
ncbi:MAG: hypothetical protein ACRBB3_02630 [Alphaproteobacteria bacterium]